MWLDSKKFGLESGLGRNLTFIVFIPKTIEERLKDIGEYLEEIKCLICQMGDD